MNVYKLNLTGFILLLLLQIWRAWPPCPPQFSLSLCFSVPPVQCSASRAQLLESYASSASVSCRQPGLQKSPYCSLTVPVSPSLGVDKECCNADR